MIGPYLYLIGTCLQIAGIAHGVDTRIIGACLFITGAALMLIKRTT